MIPVRLLIFDLDGTLVDTLDDITASVNYTLQKMGRQPIPRERVRQYVGDGVEILMTRALDGRDDLFADAVGIYKVHHSRNLMNRSLLYPHVRETLGHFRNISLAVISNKTMAFVEPLLSGLGIAGLFRSVVGADSGLALKPAPDAVLKVLADIGAARDRSVMVGDGVTDIRAGKAAGVMTCAVTYGFRSEEELRRAAPDYVINDIAELTRLFEPAEG